MTDIGLQYLCDLVNQQQSDTLLVADEHLDSTTLLSLKAHEQLTLLSNRYDVYIAATENNITCIFNDMDLSELNRKFDLILYRVSKEKAIVHHIINQAPAALKDHGQFILCGFKNEGIKTYISKAELYFGEKADISKGERQLKIARFNPHALGEALDDRDYKQLSQIEAPGKIEIFSKPGQFGWNKTDQGSLLLVDALKEFIHEQTEPPGNVLDLGCGYGLLSIMAWNLGAAKIIATDNNAAAIYSCRKNFQHHHIIGEVIADDCAASIHHQYDMVLCNPPFHRGFDTEKDLTEKFVRSASHHLKNSGTAFVVVNQFIPIEQIAALHFKCIEVEKQKKSFKVVRLSS